MFAAVTWILESAAAFFGEGSGGRGGDEREEEQEEELQHCVISIDHMNSSKQYVGTLIYSMHALAMTSLP